MHSFSERPAIGWASLSTLASLSHLASAHDLYIGLPAPRDRVALTRAARESVRLKGRGAAAMADICGECSEQFELVREGAC
jgi:hypothetical protein